jgi:hypothetical protein
MLGSITSGAMWSHVMSKERSSEAGVGTPVVLGVVLALAALGAVATAVVSMRGQAPPPVERTTTILAAGDIATCQNEDDEATAEILNMSTGPILMLGDTAYPEGSHEDFQACYDPSWGQLKARTRPVPGNHDYDTDDAAPYFAYFGPAAGPSDRGYYSFDLAGWHIVALNSNCDHVPEGCSDGSAQLEWLKEDLAENQTPCTLAYWHHARFSTGEHGEDLDVDEFFTALYEADADVVLTAHDHDYERFAPVDPEGIVDEARGVRQFVVGTGGGPLRPFETTHPASEVRNADTHGVLEMTLLPNAYEWEFLPEEGGSFTDSGRDECH